MKYSKQATSFASEIVNNYAKYSRWAQNYILKFNDIPDFDLQELLSFLMAENYGAVVEALGPDNLQFDKKMLPALFKFMQNITDKEVRADFVTAWQEGLLFYFQSHIDDLLAECLSDYNSERGFKNSEYVGPIVGELRWGT